MYVLHRCECPSGYEGISCETKVDDCIGNTCKNNVTCIDLVGSCSRGFIGVHCETKSALCMGKTSDGERDGFLSKWRCLYGTFYTLFMQV